VRVGPIRRRLGVAPAAHTPLKKHFEGPRRTGGHGDELPRHPEFCWCFDRSLDRWPLNLSHSGEGAGSRRRNETRFELTPYADGIRLSPRLDEQGMIHKQALDAALAQVQFIARQEQTASAARTLVSMAQRTAVAKDDLRIEDRSHPH
jgi:hypothetical protein